MSFYVFHRPRVCLVDHVGVNLQLVQLAGRFLVFFLSHTAPGFQLWLYFHLCRWVVHWGLAPEAALERLGLPSECQVWKWCSCLDLRGSGSTRYSGGLVV